MRHYCEYNNNPLEGTNNSIKNSSIATHPQFTLENSFEVLNQISTKRLSKLTTNVVTQSQKYCPTATSDVLDKLTIDGAEELKNQIYCAKKYQCIRITEDSWKVTRCSTSFKELETKIIPMFKIVNTVKLCNNNRLQCDCSYNQVWGIPCVHSLSVANTFISDKWNGISHNDVSVVWWKSYYLYSLPDKVDINKNKQEKIKNKTDLPYASRKRENGNNNTS